MATVQSMDDMVFGIVALVLGDLIVAVALGWTTKAAAVGSLRLNSFAGIRTATTMSSPEAWVAAHRAAWPLVQMLVALGIIGAVAALPLMFAGHHVVAAIVAGVPLVAVVFACIPMAMVANKAARSV